MQRRFIPLIWIPLAAAIAGCKSGPEYMREVSPARQLKAPADKSLVVFVRASEDAAELPAHVMDDQAAFLGTAVPGGHFSVVRPVGRQTFIVFTGDQADALVADLAPGLVYFCELSPSKGAGPARFLFKASARGTNLFPYKEEWIEETTQFRVDPQVAKQTMAAATQKQGEKVVKDANERLRKYVGIELTEHTLAQTDGHSATGIPGTVRYAAPAPVPVPIALPVATPVGTPAQPATVVAAPAPAPVAAPAPAPTPGFLPEEFPPPPPPGPPPELAPHKRKYAKGTVVRVKLKNGTTWLGEVVRQTKVDLKIIVGGSPQLLDFEDMASVEELSRAN